MDTHGAMMTFHLKKSEAVCYKLAELSLALSECLVSEVEQLLTAKKLRGDSNGGSELVRR